MYRVVNPKAVFYGHIFPGTPITIGGESRIWDNNSVGRSYPAGDCELLP